MNSGNSSNKKYKNNKQNRQMQIPNQPKRKRKGISVSLTPDKKIDQGPRGISPPIPPVRIQQSQVRIVQSIPYYPQTIRVFESIRPADSKVTFNYNLTSSKEQEIRQSQMLNQQLIYLQNQIQNKRHAINKLQQQQIRVIEPSVSGVVVQNHFQGASFAQPVPMVTRNNNSWNPCLCINSNNVQSRIQTAFESKTRTPATTERNTKQKIDEVKNSFVLNKPECQVYLNENSNKAKNLNIQLVQKQRQNKIIKQQTNTFQNKASLSYSINQHDAKPIDTFEKNSPLNTKQLLNRNQIKQKTQQIKNIQHVQPNPITLCQNEKQKQNKKRKKKNEQKLQKLRIAQTKLLEILRICNNGQ